MTYTHALWGIEHKWGFVCVPAAVFEAVQSPQSTHLHQLLANQSLVPSVVLGCHKMVGGHTKPGVAMSHQPSLQMPCGHMGGNTGASSLCGVMPYWSNSGKWIELISAMPTSTEPLALGCTASGYINDFACKMVRNICGFNPCFCAAGTMQRLAGDAKVLGLCWALWSKP